MSLVDVERDLHSVVDASDAGNWQQAVEPRRRPVQWWRPVVALSNPSDHLQERLVVEVALNQKRAVRVPLASPLVWAAAKYDNVRVFPCGLDPRRCLLGTASFHMQHTPATEP